MMVDNIGLGTRRLPYPALSVHVVTTPTGEHTKLAVCSPKQQVIVCKRIKMVDTSIDIRVMDWKHLT